MQYREIKRGDNCYICGKIMTGDSVIVEILYDRKDRKVHSTCKVRVEKARADLRRAS